MQRLILFIILFSLKGFILSQNELKVYGTVYGRDSLREAKILLYACQVEFEPYTIGGKTDYMETCGHYDEHQGQEYHLELEYGYKYLICIKDFGEEKTWLECNYSVDLRKMKNFKEDQNLELGFYVLKNCKPNDPDFKYEFVLANIVYDTKGKVSFDKDPKASWEYLIEK